mmetsp:Transcript_21466/g.40888  ORF Transcript_21466/g.40888 Transcript_21466/m.40888 type:complete len:1024 (+) Transcript_21466:252-3323(+)|eukprot:CAMPEP_0114275172 /NCGR_PEP_ID=MMETSP0058-20121206/30190_1 /TAXON_ID=36894 /ORGANISM="Pyramimonas parkeae, CCMP726" /LENGTH=1023 /DNA_ID=CAMNT_0001395079 /DNA_START=137 /DNA_END=3208 /DNA_ORIENTATION=-
MASLGQDSKAHKSIRRGHRRSALFTNRDQTDEDEDTLASLLKSVNPDHNDNSSPDEAALSDREQQLLSRMAKRHEHQQTPSPVLDEPVAARKREAVNLSTLMQLKQAFDAADDDGSGGLEMHEFVTAFLSVPSMGYQSEEQLMHLFMKIDANSDGTVDWDEFTNHMMLEQERQLATEEGAGTEGDVYARPATPGLTGARRHHFKAPEASDKATRFLQMQAHNQKQTHHALQNAHHQDMIEKVLLVPTVNTYVSAGRDGLLWLWNPGTLQALRSIRNGAGWITDMSYMATQPVAVTSVDRTISFYDSGKSSRHPYGMEPLARVNNLDNVPMCAHWVRQPDFDMLLWGDDRGSINAFTFDDFWGGEVFNPGAGVEMGNKKLPGMRCNAPFKLHTDWVTKMRYLNHSGCLVSSSMDSTLRMLDLERKKVKWMVDEHARGVYSFDFCRTYNFIASCGVERHVMLWNPFTGRSVGALYGHSASVTEVIVSEVENQLISMSTDKVVKIWDIRSHKCLQTIVDKGVYWPENRMSAMTLDPKQRAIVTAGTKLKQWHRVTRDNVGVRPMCQAMYNSTFRQVVAGNVDGTIMVWSMDRGEAVFNFSDTHEGSQLSSMVFDNSQRRLVTAARDGTLKMWNFNNGQCLKDFTGFGNQEVSCVTYLEEGPNKFVAAAGWNCKVCMWVDGTNVHEELYNEMAGHHDDIVCIAVCAPSLLATGAYDGKLILWKLDGSIKSVLEPPDQKDKTPDQRTLEKLLYMPHRGKILAAVAVDATVYFWRIVDSTLVCTLKTELPGNAKCMDVDDSNDTLFVADTCGFIFAFDMSKCDWKQKDQIALMRQRQEQAMQPRSERSLSSSSKPKSTGQPSLKYGWQAHDQDVVSLQYMRYKEDYQMLVSASTDGRVRLWTTDGIMVGTFGQDVWQTGNPITYVNDKAYYKTDLDVPDIPSLVEPSEEDDEQASTANSDLEGEEMSEERYEMLVMEKRRADLLKNKKGRSKGNAPPSNPFTAILDRRLKLQSIAPIEAPLSQFKRVEK